LNWALIIIACVFLATQSRAAVRNTGTNAFVQETGKGLAGLQAEERELTKEINRIKAAGGDASDLEAKRRQNLINQGMAQNAMNQANQSAGAATKGDGGGGKGKSSPMPPPPPPPPPEKKEEAKKPAESPMPTVSFAPMPTSSPQADKPIENSADKETSRGATSAESDTTKKIAELREQKLQSELADLNSVTEAAKKDLEAKTQAARASLNVADAEGAKSAATPAPKQTLASKLSSFASNGPRPHPAPKSKTTTGHIATIPIKKAFMASAASPMDRLFFSAKPSVTEESEEEVLPNTKKKKTVKAAAPAIEVTPPARGAASQAVEAMANKAAEEATSRYLKENSRLVAGSSRPNKE